MIMRSTLHKKFENFEKIKINSQNFDFKLTFEGEKLSLIIYRVSVFLCNQ